MNENKRHRTTKDSFLTYENKHNLSYNEYCLILKAYNYLLIRQLYEGDVFSLPNRMGTLGVYKRKTFGKGVFDYGLFAATGDKVWKRNAHSSGYCGIFQWSIKHPWTDLEASKRAMFNFTPCRSAKRGLAQLIKNNNTIHKYYDIN